MTVELTIGELIETANNFADTADTAQAIVNIVDSNGNPLDVAKVHDANGELWVEVKNTELGNATAAMQQISEIISCLDTEMGKKRINKNKINELISQIDTIAGRSW